jgi:hypothetical protein
MKRIALFVLILVLSTPTQSWAHTPVELLDTDTSAAAGPLITDGTVTVTSKSKSTITVAIGENYSVRGEISRATSL